VNDVEEKKDSLLIVEDDIDIAGMLNDYFSNQGYAVSTVNWGEDALPACQSSLPDLIILDIRLPDIDGFEVARRLRSNRKTRQLPIIFLTEKRDRKDRMTGLALNVEDYITKPFDMYELRLRVRNTLKRSRQSSLTHPVTGLPVGELVDERLKIFLSAKNQMMFINSLRNTEQFREIYGFVAADDLLRAVSIMMVDAMKEFATQDDFIGHLTDANFIIIAAPEAVTAIKDSLSKRLKQSFDYFYRDQDRDSEKFLHQRLAADFFNIQASQTFSRDVPQLRDELAKLCQASNS
jgi:DNA-binding response OmpR family regulator